MQNVSPRLVKAGLMIALLFVFSVSPGATADDDAAVVAMTTYQGLAISEWCVDNGFVLDGCQSPNGIGSFYAIVTCVNSSCDLNGFFVKDQWGSVSCTAGDAFSQMAVEGIGDGGCALIFFNDNTGVCDFQVSTVTNGGVAGNTDFAITTRALTACVSVSA